MRYIGLRLSSLQGPVDIIRRETDTKLGIRIGIATSAKPLEQNCATGILAIGNRGHETEGRAVVRDKSVKESKKTVASLGSLGAMVAKKTLKLLAERGIEIIRAPCRSEGTGPGIKDLE